MNIFKIIKRLFKSKEESIKSSNNKKKVDNDMKKSNKVKDDKSFHPEILFLINQADARYIDFEEVKKI